MAADRVTTAELKEIIGHDESEDGAIADRIDTHSGYWLKDGNDSYRFVWTIAEEDR